MACPLLWASIKKAYLTRNYVKHKQFTQWATMVYHSTTKVNWICTADTIYVLVNLNISYMVVTGVWIINFSETVLIFSERELTFTFAICYCPSVCRLSVTLVRLLSRLKFSGIFLRHLVPWLPVDIHGKFLLRSSQGNPSGMTLNDVMAPILRYFTKCVYDVVVKQLLALPRFQNLLLIVYDHINTICAIIQRLLGKTTSDNSVWRA